MKKVICALLAAAMLCALSACSGGFEDAVREMVLPSSTFRPDYRPGEENTTVTWNAGLFKKQGKWLYYTIENTLVKFPIGGNQDDLTVVRDLNSVNYVCDQCGNHVRYSDSAGLDCAIGDWLYCWTRSDDRLHVFCVRTDGRAMEPVSCIADEYHQAVGVCWRGYIYWLFGDYSDYVPQYRLTRVPLEGGAPETIRTFSCWGASFLSVSEDWLYLYTCMDDWESFRFFKLTQDGAVEEVKVSKLYYLAEDGVRYDSTLLVNTIMPLPDGSLLFDTPYPYEKTFRIEDGDLNSLPDEVYVESEEDLEKQLEEFKWQWPGLPEGKSPLWRFACYLDDSVGVYGLTDGVYFYSRRYDKLTKVSDAQAVYLYWLGDGYIYFTEYFDGPYCRVRPDGTGLEDLSWMQELPEQRDETAD